MSDERASDRPVHEMLEFFTLAEKLKTELRHSWLSNGRQESVADHCWLMALMAMVISPHLEHAVNLQRVLLLIAVHDIAETKVGDIPYFEQSERKTNKAAAERSAMAEIVTMFSDPTGANIASLWQEFEDGTTMEARFVRALDHLEVQFQHNLAAIETWEPCEYSLVYTKMTDRCAHDRGLTRVAQAIRSRAELKLVAAGVDIGALRAGLDNSL
ncbi:HD family hydrolase [Ensifer aridi]|uniref:HD domain-containing protein n=1 Tax=Ensifer aridi TaxID=1708715 RepID=UPI00358FB65C